MPPRLVDRSEFWTVALRQGKDGNVRIGSLGSSIALNILPALLTKFAKLYPDISASTVESSDERNRSDLVWGNADVAMLSDPVEDLDKISIESDELVTLIPEGSTFSIRPYILSNDLDGSPYIMTLAGSAPFSLEWFEISGIS